MPPAVSWGWAVGFHTSRGLSHPTPLPPDTGPVKDLTVGEVQKRALLSLYKSTKRPELAPALPTLAETRARRAHGAVCAGTAGPCGACGAGAEGRGRHWGKQGPAPLPRAGCVQEEKHRTRPSTLFDAL